MWFQADPFDRIKERVQDPSKHFIAFALESVAFGGIGENEQSGGNERMLDVVLQDCSELEADAIRAKLKGQFVANSGGVTIGSARFVAIYAQVYDVSLHSENVAWCADRLALGSTSTVAVRFRAGDGGHDERRIQIPACCIASPSRSSAA